MLRKSKSLFRNPCQQNVSQSVPSKLNYFSSNIRRHSHLHFNAMCLLVISFVDYFGVLQGILLFLCLEELSISHQTVQHFIWWLAGCPIQLDVLTWQCSISTDIVQQNIFKTIREKLGINH